jgi:hypothetical protein
MTTSLLKAGLKTPRPAWAFATLLGILATRIVIADTVTVAAVTADVQQVCTQPATQGQHWTVTGTANGSVGVQIKSLANAAGALSFTGNEWSGVQQVLAADQAGDNDSYRRCVEALTPLFLAKVPRDPAGVERKLRAFLAAKQLAVPGGAYGDAELGSQYGARLMPNGLNLSNPVLNGTYRALSALDSNSPNIGSFSRIFVEQNGALIGVMIVETCVGNAAVICSNNYADWKSSIQGIVGALQESKQNLDFGPGGPFSNSGGTLTKSIAYDDPWRVYVDRLDPSSGGGPTAVTLVVARARQ